MTKVKNSFLREVATTKASLVSLLLGVIILTVIILIVFSSLKAYIIKYRPHVKSIHVINLDKDIARWEHMKRSSQKIQIPVERWPAVYGKDLTQDELASKGIGYAMTRSGKGNYLEQGKDLRNQAVVGCYLSHRELLTHLASLNVPNTYGHLILEDDVNLPENFLKTDDEWHKVYQTVPMDWDIVYMDITKPVGKMVAPRVIKLTNHTSGSESGNWGSHAYLVRHGAIKSKILPWLKYMVDAYDEQLKYKFDSWNCYAVTPGIILLNSELSNDSSIQKD
jgi:GR25 family glycosyltransferase involved in LPS biosynthesis